MTFLNYVINITTETIRNALHSAVLYEYFTRKYVAFYFFKLYFKCNIWSLNSEVGNVKKPSHTNPINTYNQ